MANKHIYISHQSALFFWRTNPPQYLLGDAAVNTYALKGCPASREEVEGLALSEAEFGSGPVDTLIPPGTPELRSLLRCHVQKARIPHRTLIPYRDGIYVVSPALCFAEVCQKLSLIEAVELGMELCGTFALRPDGLESMVSRNYQLEHAASLKRKLNAWKNLSGLVRARTAAQFLVDGSASPMETKLYMLLCLPQRYGGYNLKAPSLNVEIMLPPSERVILRQESVKPDLLWKKEKLVIEYDGGYHNDTEQATHDEARRVALETMGYTVVALKKQQLYDPLAFDNVATMLAGKLGKAVRPLTLGQSEARTALRDALLK